MAWRASQAEAACAGSWWCTTAWRSVEPLATPSSCNPTSPTRFGCPLHRALAGWRCRSDSGHDKPVLISLRRRRGCRSTATASWPSLREPPVPTGGAPAPRRACADWCLDAFLYICCLFQIGVAMCTREMGLCSKDSHMLAQSGPWSSDCGVIYISAEAWLVRDACVHVHCVSLQRHAHRLVRLATQAKHMHEQARAG